MIAHISSNVFDGRGHLRKLTPHWKCSVSLEHVSSLNSIVTFDREKLMLNTWAIDLFLTRLKWSTVTLSLLLLLRGEKCFLYLYKQYYMQIFDLC